MLFTEKCAELGERGQRLLKEYDPTNSTQINTLTQCSNKRVGWVCAVCGHKWISTPQNRMKGYDCPKCANRKAVEQRIKNTLKRHGSLYDWALANGELGQKIMNEFDTEENEKLGLRMKELAKTSSKKVHWVCSKGHKWQTAVYSRTAKRSTGCPYCCKRGRPPKNKMKPI